MGANLQLLPRKEFAICLSDGTEIKGKFGTWAMKRFCDKRNIGLTQMMQRFTIEQKNPDGSAVVDQQGNIIYDIALSEVIDLILCAIEYAARRENKKFTLTDVQFCDWMDEYMHDTGESGVIAKIYLHSLDEQKKSENQPQGDTSNGMN